MLVFEQSCFSPQGREVIAGNQFSPDDLKVILARVRESWREKFIPVGEIDGENNANSAAFDYMQRLLGTEDPRLIAIGDPETARGYGGTTAYIIPIINNQLDKVMAEIVIDPILGAIWRGGASDHPLGQLPETVEDGEAGEGQFAVSAKAIAAAVEGRCPLLRQMNEAIQQLQADFFKANTIQFYPSMADSRFEEIFSSLVVSSPSNGDIFTLAIGNRSGLRWVSAAANSLLVELINSLYL
jgi:hypothetical protein